MPREGDQKTFIIGPFEDEQVREHCLRVKDTNPFHVTTSSARQSFGKYRHIPDHRVVIPGMLILEQFPGTMVGWLGQGTIFSGIHELKFPMPFLTHEMMEIVITTRRRVVGKEVTFFEFDVVGQAEGLDTPNITAKFRMVVPEL